MKGIVKKILIVLLLLGIILIPACQEKPEEKVAKPKEEAKKEVQPETKKEETTPGETKEEELALGCG